MIGDHKSFDDGSLEAAVLRLRAVSGDWVLQGILPGQDRYTDEERHKLARRGWTTQTVVDNQVVVSAVLSRAGTSWAVGRHADSAVIALQTCDPKLDDPDFIASLFGPRAREMKDPKFYWDFDDCDLVLIDATSRTGARMVPGWL
jgi:hypothetical protein